MIAAAHYIVFDQGNPYKQHYIKISDEGIIEKLEPLEKEIAHAKFFNGILFALPHAEVLGELELLEELLYLEKIQPEKSVFELLKLLKLARAESSNRIVLYSLCGIDLLAAKLRTGDGSCHCHIQRL